MFTAVAVDADGNVVSFEPEWSVVASGGTISDAGLFTAGDAAGVFNGTVMASKGSVSGTATVTVTAGSLASIEVTPDPATLGIDQPRQFTAVGRDAGGNVVSITPSWAVVDGGGEINAVSGLFTAGQVPGTFANTVEAGSDGITGTATVTVVAGPMVSIEVTPDPATLGVAEAQQFAAVGRDAGGNVVEFSATWSVVNGGGAIHENSGLFTSGQATGTFHNTIEATSSGLTGTATVEVTTGSLATIEVTPDPATLAVGETRTFTAVGRDAGGNIIDITPEWTVVNEGGSIDAGSGVFTAGQHPGTFASTVQATSGSISSAATVTVVPGSLATIEVSPNSATLAIGETRTFTAVGRDASGNVIQITPEWTVVNEGGSIDAGSGLFTAGQLAGTFTNTVQATIGSISGAATASVVAGSLATIEVTPDPAKLVVGGTQTFSAVGRDGGGNIVDTAPEWSVVNGGGLIDAVSGLFTAGTDAGSFAETVEATSGSVTGSASVDVLAGPLAIIEVSPDPATLQLQQTQQFTATGWDAEGNSVVIEPTWEVVDGGGSIVPTTGAFTAGTVAGTFDQTVRATSDGISGAATVVVVAGALATLEVTPISPTLVIGETEQFTAVGRDASDNIVPVTPEWSVVDGGGSINASSGLFTAGQTAGSFSGTVRATSGSISATASVNVLAGSLASIQVTPDPVSLAIGETQQFTAEGQDAGGNTVPANITWAVVLSGGSITEGGLFTAGQAAGSFGETVEASSEGITGTAEVVVVAGPLVSIAVTPNSATLDRGETHQFSAAGADAGGNAVTIDPTWAVVDENAGTIDPITGLFKAGTEASTFNQTIRAADGAVWGAATVTVRAGDLATIEIEPDPASVMIGGTRQFTATGLDSTGNDVEITPTWAVIAGGGTVDGAGMFTAGAATGPFNNTVEARSGTVSGTASVVVTPGPLASIQLTPNPATVGAGQDQQFTAEGRDASNNVVEIIAPVWSVEEGFGTISQSGLFTAGLTMGTDAVTIVSGSVSATATVTIEAGPLVSIQVSPYSVELSSSDVQTYTAVGYDAGGNEVSIDPTWSVVAGGGWLIGPNTFEAGPLLGLFANTIRATYLSIEGFGTVRVVP